VPQIVNAIDQKWVTLYKLIRLNFLKPAKERPLTTREDLMLGDSSTLRLQMTCWVFLTLIIIGLSGCGHHLYYQVKTGDTLYSISWQYGYNYRQVAAWNGLKPPYLIYEGQMIHLAPASTKKNKDWTLLSKPTSDTPNNAITPASNQAKQAKTANRTLKQSPSQNAQKKRRTQQDTQKITSKKIDWRWPAKGKITQRKIQPDQYKKGLNISGELGQPVRAAALGRVVYSGNSLKGYGNLIIIKHDDYFLSAYANNRSIKVKEGDVVKVGQQIAAMGRDVNNQVALYFEIRRDGKPVDPLRYLPRQH